MKRSHKLDQTQNLLLNIDLRTENALNQLGLMSNHRTKVNKTTIMMRIINQKIALSFTNKKIQRHIKGSG
jgi:hypothetical protein